MFPFPVENTVANKELLHRHAIRRGEEAILVHMHRSNCGLLLRCGDYGNKLMIL